MVLLLSGREEEEEDGSDPRKGTVGRPKDGRASDLKQHVYTHNPHTILLSHLPPHPLFSNTHTLPQHIHAHTRTHRKWRARCGSSWPARCTRVQAVASMAAQERTRIGESTGARTAAR